MEPLSCDCPCFWCTRAITGRILNIYLPKLLFTRWVKPWLPLLCWPLYFPYCPPAACSGSLPLFICVSYTQQANTSLASLRWGYLLPLLGATELATGWSCGKFRAQNRWLGGGDSFERRHWSHPQTLSNPFLRHRFWRTIQGRCSLCPSCGIISWYVDHDWKGVSAVWGHETLHVCTAWGWEVNDSCPLISIP